MSIELMNIYSACGYLYLISVIPYICSFFFLKLLLLLMHRINSTSWMLFAVAATTGFFLCNDIHDYMSYNKFFTLIPYHIMKFLMPMCANSLLNLQTARFYMYV